MPFPVAAALLAGSAVASAAGGVASANAANTGNRRVRDFEVSQGSFNQLGMNRELYGSDRLAEVLRRLPREFWPRLLREAYGIHNFSNNDASGQTPESVVQMVRQHTGAGLGHGQVGGGGGGLVGEYGRLADSTGQRQRGIAAGYDADTQRLDTIASDFGRGGEQLIDIQTARDNKAADRLSLAKLAASGFGNSTFAGNQLASNRAEFSRSANEQKLALRNEGTRLRLGTLAPRLAGRTALSESFLERDIGLRREPMGLRFGVASGGIYNPNITYQPAGQSAAGNALASAGASIGQFGGYLLERDRDDRRRTPRNPYAGM